MFCYLKSPLLTWCFEITNENMYYMFKFKIQTIFFVFINLLLTKIALKLINSLVKENNCSQIINNLFVMIRYPSSIVPPLNT